MDAEPGRPPTLQAHLQVVRRRKWTILATVVLVVAATVAWSLRQPRVYEASARVAVNQLDQTALLAGAQDSSSLVDPNEFMQSQADAASDPAVTRKVLAAAGTPSSRLSAATSSNSNILTLSARDRQSATAVALADAYARSFVAFRAAADRAALLRAQVQVKARLRHLRAIDEQSSGAYQSLLGRDQSIQTLLDLRTPTATIAAPASGAALVQPKPVRNGAVALGVGLVFGIGLAFLFETLDTAMRSVDGIAARLGLPLLARVPRPPIRLRRKDRLVMLAEPDGPDAEAFRMLRANLEFANREARHRVIMFTSAVGQEGKSTTVANLAVAAARGGQRVAIVDLDLRRPYVDRFFGVAREPGFTDVVLGQAALADVLSPVPLTLPGANGAPAAAGNGHAEVHALLEVLPAGRALPDAGDFLRLAAVGEIIAELRRRSDLVLVDAPPLLVVGDALALAAQVDALVLVTRLELLRRSTVDELRRTIDHCPADKLGFVVTEAEREEAYGYGSGYAPRKADEEELVR